MGERFNTGFKTFLFTLSNKSFNQLGFHHERYLYFSYVLQYMDIWMVTGTRVTCLVLFWRLYILPKVLQNSNVSSVSPWSGSGYVLRSILMCVRELLTLGMCVYAMC